MDDSAQVFLKSKIMENFHKYLYLIVFAANMREEVILAKDASRRRTKLTIFSAAENVQFLLIS